MLEPTQEDNTLALSPYTLLGGASRVRALVDAFYDAMETLPEAQTIRAMHGQNLNSAREKFTLYLTGWLGGPSLYTDKYGHPRLRGRHMPFAIDSAARDAWLLCMQQALSSLRIEPVLREFLWDKFSDLADFMRNTPD